MAVGSNPMLDSLVTVCNSSPGQPEPCKGNLVAVAGSCGELMVKHPWPLLEISLSDFCGLATLNMNAYLPNGKENFLFSIFLSCFHFVSVFVSLFICLFVSLHRQNNFLIINIKRNLSFLTVSCLETFDVMEETLC